MLVALVFFAGLCSIALAEENGTDYAAQKADYWYRRGLESAGAGSYENALNSFDKAISLNPGNAAFWDANAASLAMLSFRGKDSSKLNESLRSYDRAIGLYDEALRGNPQDFNAWYYRGLALSSKANILQKGKDLNMTIGNTSIAAIMEGAAASYVEAIQINPQHLTAWKNLGMIQYRLKNLNDSLQAYEKAIEIDPDYGLAWYNKGLTLYGLGRYNESLSAYNRALESFPKDANIWYEKGNSLLELEKYDEAANYYEEAIRLQPSFAEAWHKKGIAFEKLGMDTVAGASFSKARYFGYRD